MSATISGTPTPMMIGAGPSRCETDSEPPARRYARPPTEPMELIIAMLKRRTVIGVCLTSMAVASAPTRACADRARR